MAGAGGGALWAARQRQIASGAVWAAQAGAAVLEAAQLDGVIPDGPLVVENVGPGTAETPLFALLERGAPLAADGASAAGRMAGRSCRT